MPPVVVAASRFASALETGTAKLWMLLIGVDRYTDLTLPSLRYAAVDCEGIGAALAAATQSFPDKELWLCHDFAAELPTFATVSARLERIVTEARSQDTVLIYFSGHGVLEPVTQQTVLCLRDTDRNRLLDTGLQIEKILRLLQNCAAQDRLLWLDACHSGNISFVGTHRDRDATILAPTSQLLASLRQGAAQSRGFYALLSCDEGQQSWEFPDLGHGVFSYYLMRGLRGEAADERGVIDADGLYRYVYRQTMEYIDTLNQQLRAADRAKRDRGETSWSLEYSPQTPKRIVSGVGEIILGLQPSSVLTVTERAALIVTATADPTVDSLVRVLQAEGKFAIESVLVDRQMDGSSGSLSAGSQNSQAVRVEIDPKSPILLGEPPTGNDRHEPYSPAQLPSYHPRSTDVRALAAIGDRIHNFLSDNLSRPATRLLYLRGQITATEGEDAWLKIGEFKLSRNWLARELYRHSDDLQIAILDSIEPTGLPPDPQLAAEWMEALTSFAQSEATVRVERHSQWALACIVPPADADLLAQVLLEATISTPLQSDAAVDDWLVKVQTNLDALGTCSHFWKSTTQATKLAQWNTTHNLLATTGIDRARSATLDVAPSKIPSHTVSVNPPVAPTPHQLQPELTPNPNAPTVFCQNVATILQRSIGPIATTLVDRVHLWQVSEPELALELLLPLLPERERANFARQVELLAERHLNLPVAPPSTSISTTTTNFPPLPPTPPSHFPPEIRHEIDRALRGIVGPVAGVLLGQCEPTAWNTERDLIAALTPYLTSEQIAAFDRQLQQIVATATSATPLESAPNANGRGIEAPPNPDALDRDFIITCERELTLAIGPIAKFIVATTHKTHPHLPKADFATLLATKIPDPTHAAAFRRQLRLE